MPYCRLRKWIGYIILLAVMLSAFINTGMPACADGFATEFPYVVTIYNEKNGLPTGEANTILQTRDGHMWIGSYGGLIRYDGSNFRNFSMEKAIASNSIRSLYEDSQGRLWIGTNDIGVVMMQQDTFTLMESPSDNSFLCIRDFVEAEDGTIYVASPSGMARIEDDKLVPIADEAVRGKGVFSVAIDSHQRIWGCMDNGECLIIEGGKLKEIFPSERIFESSRIYCIASDSRGNILMGTSGNEVAVVGFPTEGLERKDLTVEEYSTKNMHFHNMIESIGGYLLISGNNGLAIVAPDGVVKTFGEEKKAVSINAAIIDYEQNVWMASSNYGVIKYSQGCFEPLNEKTSLEEIAINSITKVDKLWYIAHDGGVIICNRNWVHMKNKLTDMLQGVRVRHMMADSKGNLWIANYSQNPLICYNPRTEEITCYNEAVGMEGDKARTVMELRDGRVITTTQSGVYLIENGRITEHYGREDGILNSTILCFAEAENGEIYLGSDGDGIYGIKDGVVNNYGFREGLKEGVVLRIKQETNGTGYFVSAGSGLYYWENGSFKELSNFIKDSGSIFDIYDLDGKIWILQNNGAISMNKESLLSGQQTETNHYGFMHGLAGSLDANTWHYMNDDGKLYLATRNGISTFGFVGVPYTIPKLCISRVIVDGVAYEHPKELVLTSDAQRITIEYATLSYTDTTELRVQTCLKGFDNQKQLSAEKSSAVSYTNLRGGEYTFEVTAYSPDDGELATCTLLIRKEKKLVEQPLFWVLLAIGVILLSATTVLLYARNKMKSIQKRQQEYKSIIEQSLRTFANTIDAKDPYTNGHSYRVATYARELAKRMGMSSLEQENIYYIALLHDIGKIGIPDTILNKPGKLNDEELATIRKHVTIGGEILADFTALEGITEGAKYHHERWDGKGYGEGLSELDIPMVARIIGVADSYDAMSSDRCYRGALEEEVIKSELIHCSGSQFDPDVVPHMLAMMEEGMVPLKEE